MESERFVRFIRKNISQDFSLKDEDREGIILPILKIRDEHEKMCASIIERLPPLKSKKVEAEVEREDEIRKIITGKDISIMEESVPIIEEFFYLTFPLMFHRGCYQSCFLKNYIYFSVKSIISA